MSSLTEMQQRFILHWGEMGTRWGIGRAVAQIHALLMISDKALNAQEISERLSLARSNVSTALRELQERKVVKVVHVLGDRRDHFESLKDCWQMLALIADKRIEREIRPTMEMLQELSAKSEKESSSFKRCLFELSQLFESSLSFYGKIRLLPIPVLRRLLKFDRKIGELLSGE